MPKCSLTATKSKVRHIMNALKCSNYQKIADSLGTSRQVISYRMRNMYAKQLDDWLVLLNYAGYEIVEKQGD